MNILKVNNNLNLILNIEDNFKTDLGWYENLSELEKESLDKIINVADNYETVRYIHKPYVSSNGIYQTDIWFYFYFLSGGTSYDGGLDYSLVDITPEENSKLLKQSTESFFRLEFFKTPNNEPPSRINRRLVFAKNLSLPLGEKVYYDKIMDDIYVPVFMGSNYRNKENMYLFWFQDDTVLEESILTGNTFWMTAKFFNAKTGEILDFTTTGLTSTQEVNETRDMYYKVIIDNTNYTYDIYRYNESQGSRIGETNDPIIFFEKGGGTFFDTSQPPLDPSPIPPSSVTQNDLTYVIYIKSETTLTNDKVYIYYKKNNGAWTLIDDPNSTSINSLDYKIAGSIDVGINDILKISVRSFSNRDISFSEGRNNQDFEDYCGFYLPYSATVISNNELYLNVATDSGDWGYCPFMDDVIVGTSFPPDRGVCILDGTIVSVSGNGITFCESTTFTSPLFASSPSGTAYIGYSSNTSNNYVEVQYNGTSTIPVITGCTECIPIQTTPITCTRYYVKLKENDEVGFSNITFKCCESFRLVSYGISTGQTMNICVNDDTKILYDPESVDVFKSTPCTGDTTGFGCKRDDIQEDDMKLKYESYSGGSFTFSLSETMFSGLGRLTVTNASATGFTGNTVCVFPFGSPQVLSARTGVDLISSSFVFVSGTTTISGGTPVNPNTTIYVRGPIDIQGSWEELNNSTQPFNVTLVNNNYTNLMSGSTVLINGITLSIDIPDGCNPYSP